MLGGTMKKLIIVIDEKTAKYLEEQGMDAHSPDMSVNSLFITGLVHAFGGPRFTPATVLTSRAEVLPITTKDLSGESGTFIVEALKDIHTLTKYISKYGSSVIDIAPKEIFDVGDNCEKMIKAVINHKRNVIYKDDSLDEEKKHKLMLSEMYYLMESLEYQASERRPSQPTYYLPDPETFFNRDEKTYVLHFRNRMRSFFERYFPERYDKFRNYQIRAQKERELIAKKTKPMPKKIKKKRENKNGINSNKRITTRKYGHQ